MQVHVPHPSHPHDPPETFLGFVLLLLTLAIVVSIVLGIVWMLNSMFVH
ncbi:MAG: hypothetical protein QM770_09400 [Tepidisphaeraceae bacterium]